VLTFSVGIAAGLLLGSIELPLPGDATFELGFAGGPLVAGLVLGALGRTGPLVWQLPHNANLTLRQFGTVLFLAGVGTRSGQAFADTIASPEAVKVIAAGLLVTACAVGTTFALARRLPPSTLAGVIAGMQTQPAVLAYASEHGDEEDVTVGYATVYPLAMIVKIVGAQVLAALAV
jgi:putative transport protein